MNQINLGRRAALKSGSATAVFGLFVAAGLVRPAAAQQAGWNQGAFSAKGVDSVVKSLGGASAAPTKDINWGSTPEIAENGAVVPVSVTSNIPKTESIAILVEEPEHAVGGVQYPARYRPQCLDPGEDRRDLQRVCADQGRRQVFRRPA